MAGNLDEEFPDLLRDTGGFEANNAGDQQGCLPAVEGSYTIADIEQAKARVAHYENVAFDDGHHLETGFSFTNPSQPSPSQTDHSLWNLSAQQNDIVRAHPDHQSRLAVPQKGFSTSQASLALQWFGNAGDGKYSSGGSADHVRPPTLMREERGFVDTSPMFLNSTDLNRLFPQENQAGNVVMQAQYPPLDCNNQIHNIEATAFVTSWPQIQQQSLAQTERTIPRSSMYDQSMQVLSRQDETPCSVMTDGNPALVGMYGAPDSGSYVRDIPSAHLDPELSISQMQDITPAQPESLACLVCKKQCWDKQGLRKHLETHDLVKTGRYKCLHEDCPRAFRYPKDLLRHQNVHAGLVAQMFFCQEPGCAAKYNRIDNLRRHFKKRHFKKEHSVNSDSRSVLSTNSTAASRVDDVLSSTGSRLLLQRSASSSSVVDRVSSFNMSQTEMSSADRYIDPRLMSPSAAPNAHGYPETDPWYSQ